MYFWRTATDASVDKQIERVLDEMDMMQVSSEEYTLQMRNLERLYELKAGNRRQPVSSDTIAIVVTNLLGMLLIVAYEQKHPIISKGWSQVMRPRTPNALP